MQFIKIILCYYLDIKKEKIKRMTKTYLLFYFYVFKVVMAWKAFFLNLNKAL